MNNRQHQLTSEGLEMYTQELEHLRNVERIQVRLAIQEARAQGDLSENAEYDAARDEQARIEGRIKELENIIQNAVIIGSNKVYTILLEDDNETVDFTLVGSMEADPLNQKISVESPLGSALLEHKVGDRVLIKSETGYEYYVQILNIKGD